MNKKRIFSARNWVIALVVLFTVMGALFHDIPKILYAAQGYSLKVQLRNANNSPQNNTIFPWFKLHNTGSQAIDLKDVKIRYYYTIDGERDQNFWCDWASMGKDNVTGSFGKMSTPVNGADYFFELGFTSSAGSLTSGTNIEVQSRLAKSDWSNYNQTDDYSFNNSLSEYIDTDRVAIYVNGVLIWGTPAGQGSVTPSPVNTPTPPITHGPTPTPVQPPSGSQVLKAQLRNANNASSINTLFPWINLCNTSSQSINLNEVKIRYYYTVDGDKPQNFWCDWSSAGSTNITGSFTKLNNPVPGADYYIELGFKSGSLNPGGKAEIQYRAAKNDWSNYNQTNDYSFNNSLAQYTDCDRVAVYYRGVLVWGVPAGETSIYEYPVIITPENNAYIPRQEVPVQWTGVLNAKDYTLALHDVTGLTDPSQTVSSVVYAQNITGTSYTINQDKLSEGKRYKLTVGALLKDGTVKWSKEPVYFTVGSSPVLGANNDQMLTGLPEKMEVNLGGSLSLKGVLSSVSNINKITINIKGSGETLGTYDLKAKTFDLGTVKLDTTSGPLSKPGSYIINLWVKTDKFPNPPHPRRSILLTVKPDSAYTITAPEVLSPVAGSTLGRDKITTYWKPVPGAQSYMLKVVDTTDNKLLLGKINLLTETTCEIPKTLLKQGHSYKICVAAVGPDKSEIWNENTEITIAQ